MAGERRPERVIPIRTQRTIKCHNCGNDNLIHGLTLAKATMVMMIGGPGQLPSFIDEKWAIYLCIACDSFFPYPKSYSVQPKLQIMYKQILNWCEAQSELRKQRNAHLEKLVSIIESNKDLLGLPGQREETREAQLSPLVDRIDSLERELRSKKGGRPKHCSTRGCKTKAEIDNLCRAHFLEKNNE